jgi:hypothetical protein
MKKTTQTPDRPRPGRPSKGADARTRNLNIKISQNEIECWTRLGEKRGMKLREFILSFVRAATKGK